MKARTRNTDRGFTLIELLVVISIIALLVSILLPALGSARQAAIMISCQSRIRSVMQATHMYQTDHNEFYPDGVGFNPSMLYEFTLNRYLGLPYDSIATPLSFQMVQAGAAAHNVWFCPALVDETGPEVGWKSIGNYTPNPNIMGTLINAATKTYWADVFGNMHFNTTKTLVKEPDIKEAPSDNALWMDSCNPWNAWYTRNGIDLTGQNHQATPHFSDGKRDMTNGTTQYLTNTGLIGLAGTAFRDGHAESLAKEGFVGSAGGFANVSYNKK